MYDKTIFHKFINSNSIQVCLHRNQNAVIVKLIKLANSYLSNCNSTSSFDGNFGGAQSKKTAIIITTESRSSLYCITVLNSVYTCILINIMQLYIQIVDSKHNFFEIFLLTTFKTSFFFFLKSNKKKTRNKQKRQKIPNKPQHHQAQADYLHQIYNCN